MSSAYSYPIGQPGKPWGEVERTIWRDRQSRVRSYDDDVVARVRALGARFDVFEYGRLNADDESYPLYALASRAIDAARPFAPITGGVHGYETSGVMGALDFLAHHAAGYAGKVNFVVAPCVSPWAYERVCRWNRDTIDPNGNFQAGGPAQEATALIKLVRRHAHYALHIDLHETTDTDETEFRPALSARDGQPFAPGQIPDGFYLVADRAEPQLPFQSAIIDAVRNVTRIAEPDVNGEIIGSPVIAPGVIAYPLAELGLCTSITDARFTTATEIYPDAPGTTAANCVEAQICAICAALDYVQAFDWSD